MVKKTEETSDAEAFDGAIAALSKMKDSAVVDEALLGELAASLEKLSPEAYRRFMDLPIVQLITERAGEAAMDKAEPGQEIRVGGGDLPFSYKVPYSQEAMRRKWPPVLEFVADADYTIVVPGGWVFKLHRDIIYDVPLGKECPEGHGYQLPSIVVGIIRDSKLAARDNRRETEGAPFGMGVKFTGTGWAGKAEVAKSEPGGGEA